VRVLARVEIFLQATFLRQAKPEVVDALLAERTSERLVCHPVSDEIRDAAATDSSLGFDLAEIDAASTATRSGLDAVLLDTLCIGDTELGNPQAENTLNGRSAQLLV
jgi:hypothetical protein